MPQWLEEQKRQKDEPGVEGKESGSTDSKKPRLGESSTEVIDLDMAGACVAAERSWMLHDPGWRRSLRVATSGLGQTLSGLHQIPDCSGFEPPDG